MSTGASLRQPTGDACDPRFGRPVEIADSIWHVRPIVSRYRIRSRQGSRADRTRRSYAMYDHELSVVIQQERERAIREARLHHRFDLVSRPLAAPAAAGGPAPTVRRPVAGGVRLGARHPAVGTQAPVPAGRRARHPVRARLTRQAPARSAIRPFGGGPALPPAAADTSSRGGALAYRASRSRADAIIRSRSSGGSSTSAYAPRASIRAWTSRGHSATSRRWVQPSGIRLSESDGRLEGLLAECVRRATPTCSGSTRRWTSRRSARAS